jgi:hypothetical protein
MSVSLSNVFGSSGEVGSSETKTVLPFFIQNECDSHNATFSNSKDTVLGECC